jgi:hypothetical protein
MCLTEIEIKIPDPWEERHSGLPLIGSVPATRDRSSMVLAWIGAVRPLPAQEKIDVEPASNGGAWGTCLCNASLLDLKELTSQNFTRPLATFDGVSAGLWQCACSAVWRPKMDRLLTCCNTPPSCFRLRRLPISSVLRKQSAPHCRHCHRYADQRAIR